MNSTLLVTPCQAMFQLARLHLQHHRHVDHGSWSCHGAFAGFPVAWIGVIKMDSAKGFFCSCTWTAAVSTLGSAVVNLAVYPGDFFPLASSTTALTTERSERPSCREANSCRAAEQHPFTCVMLCSAFVYVGVCWFLWRLFHFCCFFRFVSFVFVTLVSQRSNFATTHFSPGCKLLPSTWLWRPYPSSVLQLLACLLVIAAGSPGSSMVLFYLVRETFMQHVLPQVLARRP